MTIFIKALITLTLTVSAFKMNFVNAQNYSISQIKGCKWIDDTSCEGVINTVWFTDSLRYNKNDYLRINKSSLLIAPYYLSNTIPQTFDDSKIGRNNTGKYLIQKEGTEKYGYVMTVKEILSISEDKLIVKYGIFRSDMANPPSGILIFKKKQ